MLKLLGVGTVFLDSNSTNSTAMNEFLLGIGVPSAAKHRSQMMSFIVSKAAPAVTAPAPSQAVFPLQAPTSTSSTMASAQNYSSASLPTVLPGLAALAGRIAAELEATPARLLTLNPSRREAIAQYLDRLAGIVPGSTSANGAIGAPAAKINDTLRRWVNHPRTPAQNLALKTFFEEVAWLTLAQALVLKTWSDRGVRAWSEADLGHLNWALSTALKPFVPLDREGWQITSRNLYSWYTPEPSLQRELWRSLEGWRLSEEGPELLVALLKHPRANSPDAPEARELRGYDSRFFKAVWEQVQVPASPSANVSGQKPFAFTPTLRNGAMVRSDSGRFNWIGFEAHPFQLMVAELIQLWFGPAAPPAWSPGTGLEGHSRDQLSLSLGSPKPTLVNRIAEIEACDLSFVLEERSIRGNGRNTEAAVLRQQLEQLPYFKKFRAPTTSMGSLQACVALTKLRPGGFMWWSREEALKASDGQEMLAFLLDKGRLIGEWDFTNVEHTLPSNAPLFPKHLYLFVREPDFQKRLDHRPTRVAVQGQIRSHIELPIFLNDVLQAPLRPSGRDVQASRAHWQIHVHQSPITQKDWATQWPDPAAHETISALEELRANSAPLASLSTIRPALAGVSERMNAKGLWIHLETVGKTSCRLIAHALPKASAALAAHGTDPRRDPGFLIFVSDESWIAPLGRYLESEGVRNWLEHHAERRGEKPILTEQLVKFLPIPKTLVAAFATAAGALPGDWERLLIDLSQGQTGSMNAIREQISRLSTAGDGSAVRAQVFVRTSRLLENLRLAQDRIFSMVGNDGRIRWRSLLNILAKSECIPGTFHPEIRITGQLPPHMPIGRIDRVKSPTPGLLFSTENGMTLHLGSDDPRILDILVEQTEGLKHPTWNELSQMIRLPRRLEVATAAAEDVLRAHGAQLARIRDLETLIALTTV